jgi:hypothetical protein
MIKSAVASPVGIICKFCIQIQNLLENGARDRLNYPKWKGLCFPLLDLVSIPDLVILEHTLRILDFPLQIQNLLEKWV